MSTKQTTYISNPFKVIFTGLGNLFKYNQNLTIILLIAGLFGSGGGFFPGGSPSSSSSSSSASMSNEQVMTILLIAAIIAIIVLPLIIFLKTMYDGISAYTAVKTSKLQSATFGEAWRAALGKFWTILGINVVVFFKVLGGYLLLIVPGIRASLRYNLVHQHVFDQNTGVKQSIQNSKTLTKDHLMEVLGMSFAAGIIPIVGGILAIGGKSVMYAQLTELKASGQDKPPVHWLNYLVFIVAVIILMMCLAVFALYALSQ